MMLNVVTGTCLLLCREEARLEPMLQILLDTVSWM